MARHQSQNNVFGLGDYDQPTEPVEIVVLPVQATSAYPPGKIPPGSLAVPTAQHSIQPFAQEASPYQQPASYPVHPVNSRQNSYNQPSGGASPVYRPAQRTRRRHLPGLIILLCVLVQAVLLARVVLMLLNITSTAVWFNLLLDVSDFLTWPARLLVAHINVSGLAGTQLLIYLEFLLTILAYGFLSRLFARFFKALFRN